MKAIIDFDRCLVVFAAVDPNLAIGLRRSRTGHLLLNLTQDWLSQGIPLDRLGSELKLRPEILCAEMAENEGVSAFMVVDAPCDASPSEKPAPAETPASESLVDPSSKLMHVDEPSVVLAAEKPVSTSQRLRAQTPTRMSTLKALLTFAAFHGACFSGSSIRSNGIDSSSSRGQNSAENQVKGQEGRDSPTFGARAGRGSRPEGSQNIGPTVLRESHPGTMLQGVTERKQAVWVMDRVLEVSAAPLLHPSPRSTWNLPAISAAGCGCQGDPRDPGPGDHRVSDQSRNQPSGNGELGPSSSRPASSDARIQSSGGQTEGRWLPGESKEPDDFNSYHDDSTKGKVPWEAPSTTATSGAETQSPNSSPSSVVVIPNQEEMTSHPGRKAARANETLTENLEYSSRS